MVLLPNWNKMERSSIAWKVINMISLIQSGKWQKRVTTDIFILQTTRMHHYKDQSTGEAMETPFTFAKKKFNIFETVFLYFLIRCNWKGLFDLYRCVHFQSCMLMCGHQRAFFASYHSEGWESTKAFAKDYGRYSNIWVNFHNHDPSHKIFPNSLSIELINSDLSSQNKSLRNSWAEQWSLKQPRKGYFVMRAFKTKGFLLAAL